MFLFFQAGGGGYNGLSSIKMEQDGMPPIASMKVGQNKPFILFFFYTLFDMTENHFDAPRTIALPTIFLKQSGYKTSVIEDRVY